MKIVVILCDQCGIPGGAHHKSAELARRACPDGWVNYLTGLDLCDECSKRRGEKVAMTGRAMTMLGKIVQGRGGTPVKTFVAIGEELGVSRQYCQQLYSAWKKKGEK